MSPGARSRCFALAALALSSLGAEAAFKVDRHTIAGGGGTSSGVRFSVSGTVAQYDADPLQPSVSGDPGKRFSVTGGFWARPSGPRIFRDGFE